MTTLARAQAALKTYSSPRMLIMLALGFSSGLPLMLTGNTFGYWLRDAGTSLTAIGFISWVGTTYALKFLWAPLIDRAGPPLLGNLGRRRGWMLVSQVVLVAGLFGMAAWGPERGLVILGTMALVVAFASATQDTVIDAWRIETAANDAELGGLTSAYQLGYRVALLATDALILVAAQRVGWNVSYFACGVAMVVGIGATFVATEPARADATTEAQLQQTPLGSFRGVGDAIVGPFVVFFRNHGWLALLMLVAICLYRLPDFIMGPMANPLYHDIGLSKDYVGGVRLTIGLVASFAGIAAAGAFVIRFGTMRALILGGIMQAIAVAAFAALATSAPSLTLFSAVMAGDNFSTSFAGVALIAYMSSLTSLGYTATQYALLSSVYAWAGRMLKGFSGSIVDSLKSAHGLMGAYEIFFIGAGAIGIPAILLFMILAAYGPKSHARAQNAPTR
jgi:MFS transporter, PAT family, beta-lactamase induction signal transducer AmpG